MEFVDEPESKTVVLIEVQIPYSGGRDWSDDIDFLGRLIKPWFPDARINDAEIEEVP